MNTFEMNLVATYLLIMSSIGFVTMGMDKRRAIKGGWRIPERTLLMIAVFGGGIGSFLGMQIFHHKTKKMKFKLLLPLTAVVFIAIYVSLYR